MLLPLDLKIHLASAPVDMRKSYQTLGVLVKSVLQKDPFCGHLFVFYNKRKDLVKILYWQKNGFCLWQKKLEEGVLSLPPVFLGIVLKSAPIIYKGSSRGLIAGR
jgi:transposase